MKTLVIASFLALTTTAALAQPFEFQKRIGSSEYDLLADTRNMSFAPVSLSHGTPSLTAWMLQANVDGVALNDYQGEIIESGPSRISLYEFVRDSPEGTAYRDYHDRYPADTDWEKVARDFRQQPAKGIAADIPVHDGNA